MVELHVRFSPYKFLFEPRNSQSSQMNFPGQQRHPGATELGLRLCRLSLWESSNFFISTFLFFKSTFLMVF